MENAKKKFFVQTQAAAILFLNETFKTIYSQKKADTHRYIIVA